MKKFFGVILILLFSSSLRAEWKSLEPGFDYELLPESVHLFRIDPTRFRFDLLLASDFGASSMPVQNYRERSGALLAINGGFFDPFERSLGLLHRNGETVNPIRKAAWGIFVLSNEKESGVAAKIIARKDWNPQSAVLAIQSGPRLVVDGRVQSFKEAGVSRRSALGVSPDGSVLVALSDLPLTLKQWALLLQKYGPNFLNLDGGGSTQTNVKVSSFSLSVEGLTGVPNAVAVFKK